MNWHIVRRVDDIEEFWDGCQFVNDKSKAKPFATQGEAGAEAFQLQNILQPDLLSKVLDKLWPR